MYSARSRSLLVLAVAIVLAAPSCSHAPEARSPALSDDTDVTLQVISHTFHVADVYLYRGSALKRSSAHRRLGRTSGHSISVFKISWRDLAGPAPVVLAAQSIGDTRLTSTGVLQINPGSLITWTLEPDLARTTAVVH